MPIYAYECLACGEKDERLQRYDDPPPNCPACKEPMHRRIAVSNFTLKGDGWARDRYGIEKPVRAKES